MEILGKHRLGRDDLIVAIQDYKGKKQLVIRAFYTDDEGALKPTSRGINLPYTKELAGMLLKSVAAASVALDGDVSVGYLGDDSQDILDDAKQARSSSSDVVYRVVRVPAFVKINGKWKHA